MKGKHAEHIANTTDKLASLGRELITLMGKVGAVEKHRKGMTEGTNANRKTAVAQMFEAFDGQNAASA
jgi:hypothetical protein